jgi:hypothetical protein
MVSHLELVVEGAVREDDADVAKDVVDNVVDVDAQQTLIEPSASVRDHLVFHVSSHTLISCWGSKIT